MQPFARGNSIFSSGKKKSMELIYRHHIIRLSRSIFCRLNLSHICVLIIDSLLYRKENATKITKGCSIHGKNPSLKSDRLSHLITTLKHWEEGEVEGGEYALDSCTFKRYFCAKHFQSALPWKYHFVFFRLVEMWGLSEIEVTTDFKQQTLGFRSSLCLELSMKGANRNVRTAHTVQV